MNRYRSTEDFRDRRKADMPGLALVLLAAAFAAGALAAILWGRG